MTYKDITINQYIELCELLKECDEKDFLSVQVSEISIITKTSEEEVLELPLPEYQKKVREIQFLSTPPQPNPKKLNTIVIAGQTFDVVKDVRKMTAGQFIDYSTFASFRDDKYIAHLLSVFVLPHGKKYGDYDQDEHIEFLANNLDIQTAFDICFFFLHKLQTLLKVMELYLAWEIRKMKKNKEIPTEKMMEAQKKLDLLKNGIGFIRQM